MATVFVMSLKLLAVKITLHVIMMIQQQMLELVTMQMQDMTVMAYV